MADLEFIGTPEERQRQAEHVLRRLHSDIYGNGRKGLMEVVQGFMINHDARENERDKIQELNHRENSAKLDRVLAKTAQKSFWVSVAAVLVAIAAVLATIVIAIVGWKLSKGENIPIHISQQYEETLSYLAHQ